MTAVIDASRLTRHAAGALRQSQIARSVLGRCAGLDSPLTTIFKTKLSDP